MATDLHHMAAARLAASGQRYTANRRAIVDVLAAAQGPLSVTELLERRRRLPQSSLYRNIAVLESAGVVRRVIVREDAILVELAEDLTVHHHHMVCDACGSVYDFVLPARVEQALERALSGAAATHGFVHAQHRLDLVGTCSGCHDTHAAAR